MANTRQITLRKATLTLHGGDAITLVDTKYNKVVDEAENAIINGVYFRGVVDDELTIIPNHAIVSLVVTDKTTTTETYDDECEENSCGGF